MIETERLQVRPASDDEMSQIIRLQTVPELKKAYLEMLQGSISYPEEREWYALWMIERKDGTCVGELCFKGISGKGFVEIGYGISEMFQGSGYATEAVNAVVSWALEQPGVLCVFAETESDNCASRRVLEKCGFVWSGKMGEEGPLFERRK